MAETALHELEVGSPGIKPSRRMSRVARLESAESEQQADRSAVVRPVRTGPIPDVCTACMGCILCRGPREEKAQREKTQREAQMHAPASIPGAAKALQVAHKMVEKVKATEAMESPDPLLYGSAVAFRSSNGAWLSTKKGSEDVRLVFNRAPPPSAIFTLAPVCRGVNAGAVHYTDSLWLRAEDDRLLGARPRMRADGHVSLTLVMLPQSAAAALTAKWCLQRAPAAVGGDAPAHTQADFMYHGDKIVIEHDWFMISCNAKHAPPGCDKQTPYLRSRASELPPGPNASGGGGGAGGRTTAAEVSAGEVWHMHWRMPVKITRREDALLTKASRRLRQSESARDSRHAAFAGEIRSVRVHKSHARS